MICKPTYLLILMLIFTPTLSGCAFVAGAAAGGAAGYMLKDKGYDVRSPVTHEHSESGHD